MEQPRRKPNRLPEFDYSATAAYFVTICTENRRNLFWQNVGAAISRPQDVVLSPYGITANAAIQQIPMHYPSVFLDHYVIMPNHIHLLLLISAENSGRLIAAPTVSRVVQQMKRAVSRELGFSPWQKGFYDHVVRGDRDYQEIWQYIDNNPVKWLEDKYHSL